VTASADIIAARLLGIPVAIAAPAQLARRLRAELRDLLRAEIDPSSAQDLIRLGDDGTVEDTPAASIATDPVQNALAEITRHAVLRSPLLCIHAGVVAAPHGLVAIPGTSGHGKTTLVAALVRAGFGYLSDEVLAVDRTSLAVAVFPRPLALDRGSWKVLDLDPAQAPELERLVAPAQLGTLGVGGLLTDVVLSTRRAGEVTLAPADRSAAMTALLSHAFNHYVDGPSSFAAAVSLARTVRSWRAEYEEATELAAQLASHFGVG